jgi:hypothetical protein
MHNCQKNYNNSKITIARNIDQIEAIRPIWEKMQQNENSPKPNADIDRYLSTITSTEQKIEPYVILLHNNSQPQAMLIGRIENIRVSCKLGYKNLFNPSLRCIAVVYGGIIGQLNPDVSALLIQTLINSLKRGDADTVFFNGFKTDSPIFSVATNLPSFLCRGHLPKSQLHWQTLIPKSEEEFSKIVSKRQQRDLARCSRNLEKAGGGPVKVVCYHQKEELEHFINAASQIYALTYHRGLKVGFVNNPLTRSLLEQAAADKWLRAYLLYAGSEPVAFEVGCVYGNVYFAEHAGFNPHWKAYSPGILLQLKIFEDLNHEGGVDIYDYGFGDAAYKQRYGNVSWPESSIYIFAPHLYPILLNLALTSTSAASSALNYLVTKAGVYNWVKRHWRALLLRKRAAPANNQEVN